jgi:hypothetical protein
VCVPLIAHCESAPGVGRDREVKALSACQPRRDIPAVNVKNPPRRNRTMMFVVELRRAALNLHTEVARWVRRTLDGGWFRIEPGGGPQVGTGTFSGGSASR